MISEIVNAINENFAGIKNDAKLYGIAQQVFRQNTTNEELEFIPGIIGFDGEIKYVGFDDVNSLMLYHKINSSSFAFQTRSGYGDTKNNTITYNASIIVYWDIRKINLFHADLNMILQGLLPQEIKGVDNVNQVLITPVNSILSTAQIFQSEYRYAKNQLLPQFANFIQINYNIQIFFDQKCIQKCIC